MDTFPLNTLKPSPQNVRKTGGASIAELAASIHHHGLIHPLSVTSDGAVVAGNRRLQALQLLAQRGDLADDAPVSVTIVGHDLATEISLAENVMREAMHPADEFDAFQRLVDQDKLTPAEIAQRFGVTERHVQQRLRLANLAPVFLKLYRDGNATLEQLMALAVTDDSEAQLKAWGGENQGSYYRMPERLREALLEREITSDDGLVQFVGLDDYRAAGGKVREDLFSDVVILLDSALVNRLAQAKLQAHADKLVAKGWGWAEARVSWPYADRHAYKQSAGKEPSALLGVIVTLKDGGKLDVVTGLTKPGAKAPKDAKPTGQAQHQQHKVDPKREVHAKLAGIRLGVVRNFLRDEPDAALAILTASLAADYFNVRGDLTDAVCTIAGMPGISPNDRAAIAAVDPSAARWHTKWQRAMEAGVKKTGSVLAWVLSLGRDDIFELLQFLAIEAVEPTEGWNGDEAEPMHQAIQLLGITLSDHWQLTAGWLQAQGKAYILAALEDALGKAKAEPFGKLKADKLAGAAEQALLQAGWLPAPMRVPVPAAKAPAKKAAKKKAG